MELSNHIVREQQPTYLWDSGIDESVVGSRNFSHKAVESSSNIYDASAIGEFPVVVKTEKIDNDYEESRHTQGNCIEMNRLPFITFNGDKIKTENFTEIDVKPEPDMDVPVFFMKDQVSQCDFVGDKYGNRQGHIKNRNMKCAKTPLVYIDIATENDFKQCEQKKRARNSKIDESKESKGKVQKIRRVKKSTSGKTFRKKTSRSKRKNREVGKELQTKMSASGNTKMKQTSRKKIQAEDEETNAKPLSGTDRKRRRKPIEDMDGDDDKTKVTTRRQKREKYFCDICEKDIIGAHKIKQHKRQHENPPSGKLLRCTLCSMAFRSQERFDGHMRTHRGEDAFTCSVCGKVFRLMGHLRSHMKSHTRDNINKLLRCTLCPVTFRSQERFDGHMRTHRGEDAFSCSLCGKGFHLLGHLRSHMKSHTGEKPYKCEICGKGFAEACKRVRHLKTHIRRGELALNGRSTSDLGDVSDPSAANGESSLVDSWGNASSVLYRPYKCSICTKTFTRTVFLVNHVQDHKDGKIIPIFGRFKQQLSESEKVCVNGMDVTDMAVKDPTHGGSNQVDDESRKSDKVTNGSDIVELRKCDNVTNCSGNVHSRKCEEVPNDSGKVESKQCDQMTNCIEDGRTPDKADEGSNHMVSSYMSCTTQESGDAAESDKDVIPVPKVLETRPVVEAVSEWSRKLEHSEECSKNADLIDMKNYPFQCAYCDELFCDPRIIEGHVLLHTSAVFLQKEKTREYTCEYCGKSFYKRGHLKAHVMIHTGERPYICEVCAKGFTESSKLTRHLKTHYNSASKKDTKTENSDSSLTLSNLLFRKSQKKNHFCEYCGKSFLVLSRLNIHVMQHTGERPFTCDLCGKGFCVPRGLKRHLNTHERKKDVWISGASSSEEAENEMSDVSYNWEEEEEEENMDMENVENEEDQYDEESSDLKDDKDDLTDLSECFSISDAEKDHDQKKNVKTKASSHRKKKMDKEETDDDKLDDEDEDDYVDDDKSEDEDDVVDDEDDNKSKNFDEDEDDMPEDVDHDDKSNGIEWSDILDGGCGEEVGEFMPFRAFQVVRSRHEKDETDKDISDESEDGDSPSSQVERDSNKVNV